MTNMKKLALVISLAVLPLLSIAQESASKVYAVAFHADWCKGCQKLGPKMLEVKKQLKGKNIEFVKIDMTNDLTIANSREVAAAKGLIGIMDAYRSTGFIVLVDAETMKEVGKITAKQKPEEMLTEINKHL